MKIKTNLILLAMTFIILIVTLAFIMVRTSEYINEKIRESNAVNKITKDVFELNIITYEYLEYHGKRMQKQWLMKYDSLGKLLKAIRKEKMHPEHLPVLESITSDYKILGDSFLKLQANYTERKRLIEKKGSQSKINTSLALEKRLITQSLFKSQKMLSEIFKLSATIEQEISRSQEKVNSIILFSIIGIIILSVCVSFLTIKAITKPINKLIKGTTIIGKGNLEHKIDVRTKNEMGQLADSFNKMTKDLQETTVSIDELRATEQQLRASNQQLRASEQQLRASNQQLRANEQQLKATEQQLQESEARYRNLIEETHEIIQSIAPDGSFIFVNPAWFKIFGYTESELKKMKVFDIIHPDSLGKCQELFHKVMSGETVDSFETTFVAKNGKHIIVEGTAVPRLQVGKVIATQGFFRDVTERKEAEKEKGKIQNQLIQSQKMEAIGTLAAGVAHDFNNLLTTIQGNVYLAMLETDKNSTVAKDIEEIKVAAGRAASLTQQLLLFSKKQPMGFVSLNINRTIENLMKMLKRLIGEDITINTQLDPELWIIDADEVNIEQVITNITVNARDAMPKGGTITLKTENIIIEEKQKDTIPNSRVGRFVRLSIEDTGVGMDKDTISRIFEPFFSTKESGKGTGLGMSVVYGIVEQHKGWINVYSEPGQGSIFKIYLPAATSKKEAKIEEKTQISNMSGDNERILLVEDDEAICKFAIRLLENNNYTVFSAGNKKDAMKIFKKENGNFDLIISDMVLTDGTGIDLIEKMISNNPKLKILLTSGYLDEKSKWSIIKMKGYKFLQKPYEIHELLETIRRLLSESKNSDS